MGLWLNFSESSANLRFPDFDEVAETLFPPYSAKCSPSEVARQRRATIPSWFRE